MTTTTRKTPTESISLDSEDTIILHPWDPNLKQAAARWARENNIPTESLTDSVELRDLQRRNVIAVLIPESLDDLTHKAPMKVSEPICMDAVHDYDDRGQGVVRGEPRYFDGTKRCFPRFLVADIAMAARPMRPVLRQDKDEPHGFIRLQFT